MLTHKNSEFLSFKFKGAEVSITVDHFCPNKQSYKKYLSLRKDYGIVRNIVSKYCSYNSGHSTLKSLLEDGKYYIKNFRYNVNVKMGDLSEGTSGNDLRDLNYDIVKIRRRLIFKLARNKKYTKIQSICDRANQLFDRQYRITDNITVYGSRQVGYVHATSGQILKMQNIRRSAAMFKAVVPKTSERHVGIEIECGINISREDLGMKLLDLAGFVMIKNDGSVSVPDRNSVEINICAPLSKYKDILQRVTNVLNSKEVGAKVNKSCGLHVHLDVREWSDWTSLNDKFAKLVSVQSILYKMQPKSRQDNHYCKRTKTRSFRRGGSRYHGINPQSIFKYRTIEVRLHAGTTEFDKIANWVDLISGVMYSSTSAPKRSLSSIRSFFRTFQEVPTSLMEYVIQRTRKFEDANAQEDEMAQAV